ncbi:MAG: hypothetical protein LAO79_26260 [Acidobacteriia bacterium]|nr:hypothetical protein [Terriglobia bacterium]
MRLTFRTIAILAVLCSGCGTLRLNRQIREYARLAVALGARDPDSLDFSYGSLAAADKNPPRLDEIRTSALALQNELQGNPEPRARRLSLQAQALAARAGELLGARMDFAKAGTVYFGLRIPGADPDPKGEARAEIDRLLDGAGTLAERYAAFDAKFVIPPERLPLVFARAVAGCRDQTVRSMPLPSGENVVIEYVHDKPWSAFSRYLGNYSSVIQVNADLALTVDRALQLACHEGYPGHHAYNSLHEERFVRGEHWLEWTVQPSFTPQALASEALATIAAQVAFPGEERFRFERDALFPLAGVNAADAGKYERIQRLVEKLELFEPAIARDFADGKLEWQRAAEALEQQALMAHPEQTLKYIAEYRSYMLTYTVGRALAARHVVNWAQFDELVNDPDAASRIMNPE